MHSLSISKADSINNDFRLVSLFFQSPVLMGAAPILFITGVEGGLPGMTPKTRNPETSFNSYIFIKVPPILSRKFEEAFTKCTPEPVSGYPIVCTSWRTVHLISGFGPIVRVQSGTWRIGLFSLSLGILRNIFVQMISCFLFRWRK